MRAIGMLAMLVVMAMTVSLALGDVKANVQSFINRVLVRGGVPAGSFVPTLELIDYAEGGLDVYELDGKDNTVIIRGSSGPALTAAVGQYFKKYLKCDVYWELGGGYQMIAFPQEIPIPQTTERQVFLSKKRYYQNTCTASYTFAWRNWTSYEQEIDWMAFHGINLPLAFTGQEFLWQELYRGTFGVSQQGMDQFFTGPGFLAWNRMSNMRAFAGPLPQGWIDQQFSLQKQILQRYKELGIEPVLPAFNGVVPEEMVALYPTANITRLTHAWCDFPSQFCCPYVVSSTDPLFVEIGSTFLKLQRAAYGDLVADAHTYNTDTFNENVPNSNDSSYLASSSSAVFSSMRQGDPAATWLMQAWLFVENPTFWSDDAIAAYLGGVPDDGMLVLDLTSDEVPVWSKLAANKKSFIWCLLHNYGGSRALYGNLTMLAHEPLATLQTPSAGSYFSGTGMTMEAIDQNPLVYEFFTEVGIYGAAEGLPLQKTEEWVQQYAVRRYGLAAPGVSSEQQEAAVAAWSTLLKTSYSGYEPCHHPTCPRRTIITARPLLNMTQETLQAASPLVEVWSNLQRVASSAPLNALGPLRYDLVDVGRQVMSNLFWDVYQLWQASFRRADVDSATALTKTMLSLIADWDSLLLTHEGFLFGRWVGDAKAWARGDETEAEIYLINAKNQVTLWGPKAADLPNLYGYNIGKWKT